MFKGRQCVMECQEKKNVKHQDKSEIMKYFQDGVMKYC